MGTASRERVRSSPCGPQADQDMPADGWGATRVAAIAKRSALDETHGPDRQATTTRSTPFDQDSATLGVRGL